jgi:hypothetical protein
VTKEQARAIAWRRRGVQRLLDLCEEARHEGLAGFGLVVTAVNRGEALEGHIAQHRVFAREDRERVARGENPVFGVRAGLHERVVTILEECAQAIKSLEQRQ